MVRQRAAVWKEDPDIDSQFMDEIDSSGQLSNAMKFSQQPVSEATDVQALDLQKLTSSFLQLTEDGVSVGPIRNGHNSNRTNNLNDKSDTATQKSYQLGG